MRVRAAQQHLDPRRHLTGRERLDEIIVAAGAQARDPLVDVTERADHQHRHTNFALA